MRILLVEDNADHRELMSLALTGHDPTWQVEGVVSGEEALRRLGEEAYDLVFLDYSLPGRNGLEVLEEIRQDEVPPPVVVVTGRGDEQVAVGAMKAGAYDYVVKQEGYLQRLPVVAQRAIEAYRLAVERRRAEEALRRSKREWESTFDAMADWVSLVDLKGRVLRTNRVGEEVVGLALADMVGQTICKLVHGPEEPIPGCPLQKVLHTHRREFAELQVPGEDRWLMVTVDPVMDDDGNLVRAVHIVRDITERKQAEEALRENKEYIENVIRSMAESLIVVSPQGAIQTVNAATCAMLGYEEKELVGQLVGTIFEEEEEEEEEELVFKGSGLDDLIKQGSIRNVEKTYLSKDGRKIPVLFSGSVMRDDAKIQGIVCVALDITERKRAEEEREHLFEQVQAGRDRLSQLTQQVVSAQEEERKRIAQELHDELGQALTGIVFDLATIQKELPPEFDPAIKDMLAEASSLANQLDEHVSEIALDLRPYMLDDLGLVPALRWYVHRYARRVDIEVEMEVTGLEDRLPPQTETALYRVMQEALTNVARHAQASRVHLHLERTASAVVASIEDDGRGFDAERIAGPQGPERGAGLLGMRERVTSLGGTFSIQSRPGEGTRLAIEVLL